MKTKIIFSERKIELELTPETNLEKKFIKTLEDERELNDYTLHSLRASSNSNNYSYGVNSDRKLTMELLKLDPKIEEPSDQSTFNLEPSGIGLTNTSENDE